MNRVSPYDSPLLEEERPAKDILWRVDIDLPTAEEVREARIAANLNGAQFGREVGRCRAGWLHGEPLARHPYRRSPIHMIENGKIPVSKAFAVAFRRWQGRVPTGVIFLSGARSIVDIPEEQIIVWGKLIQCESCGGMLIGHPLTWYLPESVSPECRADVRRRQGRGAAGTRAGAAVSALVGRGRAVRARAERRKSVHVQRQGLWRAMEATRPAEAVPTPGAVASPGDDCVIAAVRLAFFLCLLAVDLGLLPDYRESIVAHSPLLYGMVAVALGCLAGAAFHIVPDYV